MFRDVILAVGLPGVVCAVLVSTCGCASIAGLADLEVVERDAQAVGESGAEAAPCKLSAPAQQCPEGMKAVPGGFCIDKTEVTWEAYEAWYPAAKLDAVADFCKWKTSFKPSANAPPEEGYPVTNVDWCDAFEYCKAKGKRLCGAMDAAVGHLPEEALDDACQDQWYSVCSSGGENKYTYGSIYAQAFCNHGVEVAPKPVGSFPYCTSPSGNYVTVTDMNGNVWEWVDSCVGYSSESLAKEEACYVRGGGCVALDIDGEESCFGSMPLARQTNTFSYVGFRCCSK